MRLKVLCTGVETRTGVKDGRQWSMTTASLQDMQKPMCKTRIDVNLHDDDLDLKDSIEGEVILVDVTAMDDIYKGAIRATGRIVREQAATAPKSAPGTPPKS